MTIRIPVVAIADNKQAFAIGSLFTNLVLTANKNTFYELNAVLAPDFTNGNIKTLLSLQNEYSEKCKINVVRMDTRFDNIKNKTGHIANACAYKMCLAEVLPQYDKVVYLDTDTIVFNDLQEMYETELGDNYIGGVFSPGYYLTKRDLIVKLDIPDMDMYVNAGILLFNLQQIRKDNLEPKLQELIGSFDDSVDQHIFNKVCYGRIKLLPFKWNAHQSFPHVYQSSLFEIFSTSPMRTEILDTPAIFHYTGLKKPWLYYDLKYSYLWYQYFKKSPFADSFILNRQASHPEIFARQAKLTLETVSSDELPSYKTLALQFFYKVRGSLKLKKRLKSLLGMNK